jgi:hypothetical protein
MIRNCKLFGQRVGSPSFSLKTDIGMGTNRIFPRQPVVEGGRNTKNLLTNLHSSEIRLLLLFGRPRIFRIEANNF